MAQTNTVSRQASSANSRQDNHPEPESSGRQPAERFHDGPVHVSIWENDGPTGAFRKATFQLRYKDKDEQWQSTYSYGASDLKHLESAAQEARARIERWQQQSKPAPQARR